MTTPEQLAKWREEFESIYHPSDCTIRFNNRYANLNLEGFWQGYLRRCQETEQAMKLAKFGAMVLSTYKEGYVSDEEIGNFALSSGCITQPIEAYAPNIEATTEQLLKEQP